MKKILLLTDYKGRFGSKHFDKPYRSGLDKKLLERLFNEKGFLVIFKSLYEANTDLEQSIPILYTSSEDNGYYYKSYIEDIIYSLEISGYQVIPSYQYLRSNNNKVFMEIIRNNNLPEKFNNVKSSAFGSLEEMLNYVESNTLKYPVVIKKAEGASGSGVYKASSKTELIRIVRKISRTRNNKYEIHDHIRKYLHNGYVRDSLYRRKFIIQEFIPDLINDWKVYVFGKKIFVFYRPIFKHRGFRASGGGYDNYFYGTEANLPKGLLDFAMDFFNSLNVPHASLDIAFNGKDFFILEFQLVYFGTAGIVYSDGYFTRKDKDWTYIKGENSIENIYVDSIIEYLDEQ